MFQIRGSKTPQIPQKPDGLAGETCDDKPALANPSTCRTALTLEQALRERSAHP